MSRKKTFSITSILFVALLLTMFSSCIMEKGKKTEELTFERPSVSIDLEEILERGKITVLFENSSSSYFIYKEREMGFEYELLKRFADEIGVKLEVKVVKNLDNLTEMLNNGEGDLIACNYTMTRERSKLISFSEPFIETHQVLVERKPENWKSMKEKEWKAEMISSPDQLARQKVRVWKNSSYHQRLIHLQDEIGDTIYIEGADGSVGGEELIEMVSEGIIDYTIIEENVANINKQFFDNIHADVRLSVNQRMAFGIRKTSHLLKAKLDEWLNQFKKTSRFKYIKKRYFESKHIGVGAKKSYASLNGTSISKFDSYFKNAAEETGWDWRMIAAISYQESKFNPDALSFGGAYGMMQFMPNTGPTYGVFPDSPPEVQIMGGARKLKADEKFWSEVPDPLERKKFAMASYNAGRGHIKDAQRLAKKHGLDHLRWEDNVEKMILNLSKQEYYQDEVVRHGMIRSKITYNYVLEVTERYFDWVGTY
ncbi:MAG: transporter substrate-binding domain-containing protein [Crocinitomicaceae bacterium]|nr:transporter substrate-binding domain-containing protein [Crocinitomicaceae bacterium]